MIGPFVGREREIAQLNGALQQIVRGRGAVFLIGGEPGIGKTRLADAIARDAETLAFSVAWGRCWDGEGAPPYWPWSQLLESIGAQLPKLGTDTDTAHARFALFETVRRLLIQASTARPLLLVIDDLHAADTSSLLLLELVARSLRTMRVGIVATLRDVDACVSASAGEVLAKIAREATHVALHRFERDEIRSLALRLGLQISDDVVRGVVRITDGHPLFVDQVLRHLPPGRAADAAVVAIPPGLRAMLQNRIRRVPGAHDLMELVAVIGHKASLPVLARAVALSPAEVHERLESAIATGLLARSSGDTISFSHALFRDELYVSLAPDRRAVLHAKVAEVLEELEPIDPPVDAIAHHSLEGLPVVASEQAIRATLKAADRSMEMLAFEESAALLGRALRALEPIATPVGLCDVLTARGLALLRTGAVAAGKDACNRAADLARKIGDVGRFARAALTHGAEFTLGRTDPTLVALLEESLAWLPRGERVLRAPIMARLAAALQPAKDPTVPMAMAMEAVKLSEGLDATTRRSVLYNATSALADRQECIELNGELAELASAAGDRVQALRTHGRLVFAHMDVGNVELADAYLETYAGLVTEFRQPRFQWPLLLMRAMRALFDGRFSEVDRLHERLDGDEGLKFPLTMQRFYRMIESDRLAEAAEAEREIGRILGSSLSGVLFGSSLRARLFTRHRDKAATRAELDRLKGAGVPLDDLYGAKAIAEAVAYAGDPSDVLRVYEVLLAHELGMASLGASTMVVDGPVGRLLGLLAAALGRTEEAAQHLKRTVERLEHLGAAGWLARTRREADDVASSVATPIAASLPEGPAFTLRIEAARCEIACEGKLVTLKAFQGVSMLSRLIENPGRDLHALSLVSGDDVTTPGDAGDALDARAVSDYRRRVESLRTEIEEAESFGDVTRASAKREELDFLARELARGVGLGGRRRRAASDTERARINAQRHLRKAIRAIADEFPKLARHLDRCVKTGTFCRYDPE